LTIEGAEVEVDTSVIEHLKDPLTHMIRNAIDHGVETPEARQEKGKDPMASITLRAFHDSDTIVIQLSDDGAGIDRQKVVDTSRLRGVAIDPDRLTEQEIYQLIFEPGFTTADGVSDLSGRGIGMDVVRRNIEALQGSVEVHSVQGEGTTITMRLPLTLAVIDGLTVRAGDDRYVVALDSVLECLDLPADDSSRAETSGVVSLRGECLPYVKLRHLFGADASTPVRANIVVVKCELGRAGLAVDELCGESQVVIKPLGKLFSGAPAVSGSTILADGRVALILDVPGLLRQVLNRDAAAA
jgi:two-component system chemotaxis sensor kinase CheA